ncbi:unnamed protein product, partial [Rangifer tarandus platyrhynchus]
LAWRTVPPAYRSRSRKSSRCCGVRRGSNIWPRILARCRGIWLSPPPAPPSTPLTAHALRPPRAFCRGCESGKGRPSLTQTHCRWNSADSTTCLERPQDEEYLPDLLPSAGEPQGSSGSRMFCTSNPSCDAVPVPTLYNGTGRYVVRCLLHLSASAGTRNAASKSTAAVLLRIDRLQFLVCQHSKPAVALVAASTPKVCR